MPIGTDLIRDHLATTAATLALSVGSCALAIAQAAQVIADAFRNGHHLFICGNGGSAADAQHMASELVAAKLPAIALTTDTSILTATANDFGYETVFSRQLEALAVSGDVLVVISTSGRSRNVLVAAEVARAIGIKVISLTGRYGLRWAVPSEGLSALSILTVAVSSTGVATVQECHLAIEHVICELVVAELAK